MRLGVCRVSSLASLCLSKKHPLRRSKSPLPIASHAKRDRIAACLEHVMRNDARQAILRLARDDRPKLVDADLLVGSVRYCP